MGNIAQNVIDFFEKNNWVYSQLNEDNELGIQLNEEPTFQVNFEGENGSWVCYTRINEEKEYFIFYSYSPVIVPPQLRPVLAEFLTNTNYSLLFGNFEMSFEMGTIRFKTGTSLAEQEAKAGQIKHLIVINLLTMDYYLPELLKMISDKPDF